MQTPMATAKSVATSTWESVSIASAQTPRTPISESIRNVVNAGRSPEMMKAITAALIALSTNGTNVRNYDVMSAAVLIGALQPLLIYFFGGRYFIRGLTQGAIK